MLSLLTDISKPKQPETMAWKPPTTWQPPTSKFSDAVSKFVDYNLPNTVTKRKVKGEAFDGGEALNIPADEVGKYTDTDNAKDLAVHYPVTEPARDFTSGIRALWLVSLILAIVATVGFLVLVIYFGIVQGRGLLPKATLVAIFSIFNSDPVNHPNQFYPAVWYSTNYYLVIPMIIVLAVSMVANWVRTLSLWSANSLIDPANLKSGPVREIVYGDKTKTYDEAKIVNTGTVFYFDADNYQKTQLKNFYVHDVYTGVFRLRWIEWLFCGGALLWAVLTNAPVQDVFMLSGSIVLFGCLIGTGYLHEWVNRVTLSNVDLRDPFINNLNPRVKRKPKNYFPFVIGMVINIWIALVLFIYWGYASQINSTIPGTYPWYSLAIVPIIVFFFLLGIPVTMIIWSTWKGKYYEEIYKLFPKTREENDLGVLPPRQEPLHDEALSSYFKLDASSTDRYFWNLKPKDIMPNKVSEESTRLRRKVEDYVFYQDWNKNVVYEITVLIMGAVCSNVIIWLYWAGIPK